MKSSHGWLILALVVAYHGANSQDSTARESPLSFTIGTFMNYGSILAHSDKLEYASNAVPIGFGATFDWQRTDRQTFNLYHCFPQYSLIVAYYDFDKPNLGKGIIVSYSLEPHFMLSESVSIYPKFSAGLGFLSNPYDSISNANNKAYSLPVNVYLSLGGGVRWQFSNKWAMNVTAQLQHVSNGGIYKPNIGVNWPTVGFGVVYSPHGLELKKYDRSGWSKEKTRSQRFDVQLFGMMKFGNFSGTDNYYPIAGLNLTKSWQVARIHGWTAAVEAYHDQHLQERSFTGSVTFDGNRVGILAGHEFILGKYIVSQQIGLYIVGSLQDDLVYHRWGLHYFFLPRWSAGINLLVHRQTADFTDLRLTYSISKK